ncbi:hypothetical protein CVT25_014243 [Psilocybe cyanescens]|uniref:Uncharacterized protein n=1 Tax=Psilocybe cyanescens TaxID=93625 RepID=A0A409XJN7_PSICY|nr:hypothetical protein CVT25_014243 [Psilocybe cyanescens]
MSIVFAEQEHSAPLASVRESMRHQLLSLSGSTSTSSSMGSVGRRGGQVGSERTTEREGRSVQDGLNAVYNEPAASAQESDANGVMSAESSLAHAEETHDISNITATTSTSTPTFTSTIASPFFCQPNPNTHPPPAPPSPSPSPSKDEKRSWLSSLTRPKGKVKSAVQAAAALSSSLPYPSSSSPSKATSSPKKAATAAPVSTFAPSTPIAAYAVTDGAKDGDGEGDAAAITRPTAYMPCAEVASTRSLDLALASGSGAGASISLPSSPSSSSLPSPAPYITPSAAATASSSSSTSLPLPLPLQTTTTIAPKSYSASSSSSKHMGQSTGASISKSDGREIPNSRSRPKNKSTRSWFYSSPPASPAPVHAALELEGSVDGGERGQGDSMGEEDADVEEGVEGQRGGR